MLLVFIVALAAIAAYAAVARRFERLNVTGPIVFTTLGLVLGLAGMRFVTLGTTAEVVRQTTSVALVLLLFSDAATIDLAALRKDARIPLRLLLIGLPLTILLGAAAARLLYPALGIGLAVLIASILAPTDLSLGLAMFQNPNVPPRVSRVINVESGLNDGIAAPFVALATALAIAEFDKTSAPLLEAGVEIALGIVVGVVIGFLGAKMLSASKRSGWSSAGSRQFAALALALIAYTVALATHGNGFIAAFVGGITFGAVGRDDAVEAAGYSEETGTLLTLLVWLAFGMGVLPALVGAQLSWRPILYALLSLTVIRMIPVAIALIGTRLHGRTVLFAGWFGPRGLASVVFMLQALVILQHAGVAYAGVAATAGWTILLSVMLHGVSAGPVAGWYGRVSRTFAEGSPELEPSAGVTGRHRAPAPSAASGDARP